MFPRPIVVRFDDDPQKIVDIIKFLLIFKFGANLTFTPDFHPNEIS